MIGPVLSSVIYVSFDKEVFVPQSLVVPALPQHRQEVDDVLFQRVIFVVETASGCGTFSVLREIFRLVNVADHLW